MSDTLTRLEKANPELGLLSVEAPEFGRYGRVLSEYDPAEIIERALELLPESEEVVYEASVGALEKPSAFSRAIARSVFGGMPVQVGWCYGQNSRMDAVEYHKGIEVLVCLTDVVLLVGDLRDVAYGGEISYDSKRIAAFFAPRGSVVEFHAWNLHFAPIHAHRGGRFATLVYLAKGTNEPLSYSVERVGESRLLLAMNKWLIAHPDAVALAEGGAYVGITGENIVVTPV